MWSQQLIPGRPDTVVERGEIALEGYDVIHHAARRLGPRATRSTMFSNVREPRGEQHMGAPEGIRTPNLLIRSQMLYPLSYGRLLGKSTVRLDPLMPAQGSHHPA